MIAAMNDHVDVVRLLLEKGANLNIQTDDFFDPNVGGGTALIFAAYKGHVDVVRLLLEKDADINAVNPPRQLYTPLFKAIFSGNADIVRLLLENGANTLALSVRWDTALMYADHLLRIDKSSTEVARIKIVRMLEKAT